MKPTIWHGCYDKSLNGFIVHAAFSHPAKFSLGLIERIYDHLLERGWLKRGDCVGDPFGGVAIGGLVAAYRKLEWCGVELESKFVALAEQNIALHQSRLNALGAPWPRIIQGDSRKFHVLIGESDAVVSSPPYADSIDRASGIDPSKVKKPGGPNGNTHQDIYGEASGQIGRLKSGEVDGVISSPPYSDSFRGGEHCGIDWDKSKQTGKGAGGNKPGKSVSGDYGKVAGQIGRLSTGEVQAVISSPPYSDIAAGAGGLNTKPAKHAGQQAGRSATAASQDTDQRYGHSDGQISQLKGGSVEAVVSSPPYSERHAYQDEARNVQRAEKLKNSPGSKIGGVTIHQPTGESKGQISALKPGDVHAVVSSPPWENNCEGSRKASKFKDPAARLKGNRGNGASDAAVLAQAARDEQKTYGDSAGQIGQEKAESYWQAMDLVYRSCFQAIKPGGVIAIVVKDYCKAGKRVRLCDDTLKLLCHIGFTPLERIHAMLVSETVEAGLFGEERTKRQRKSFFRRLHEDLIQAQIHWVNVERKPFLLRRAKAELWSGYRDRVDNATEKEKSDPSLWPPPKPTRSKVLREAQFFAWREAGKPMRADERRIDHEEVLVCRKPL